MKKLMSIIALIATLFSSMGTSISVYAGDTSKQQKQRQQEQEKLGGLHEKSLFILLKNKLIKKEGLKFLANLKSLDSKLLKVLLASDEQLKKVKSKQSFGLKTKFDSNLAKIYNSIYGKLAKGGLTKEQFQNFKKWIIRKKKKNNQRKTTNNGENSGKQQKVENRIQKMNHTGTPTPIVGDNIKRKYVDTKFQGCDENDININGKIWASCNASYKGMGEDGVTPYVATYNGQDINAKDINGWKYGLLYKQNIQCPYGYKVPSFADFSQSINNVDDVRKLKLPFAGGYFNVPSSRWGYKLCQSASFKYYNTPSMKNKFYKNKVCNVGSSGQGIEGNYILSENYNYYFNNNYRFDDRNKSSLSGAFSLRCIRRLPATEEEQNRVAMTYEEYLHSQNEDKDEDDDKDEIEGIAIYIDEGEDNPGEDKSSNDEYVNSKLKEINDCFLNTYNSHLKNLNDTIKNFENTRDRSKNQETKNKYQKAIDKLKEIKRLFILRYKNILDYKSGNFGNSSGTEQGGNNDDLIQEEAGNGNLMEEDGENNLDRKNYGNFGNRVGNNPDVLHGDSYTKQRIIY